MQPRLKEKALVDLEIRGRAWRLLGHNIPVVSVFSKQSNLNPHQTKRKKKAVVDLEIWRRSWIQLGYNK